MLRPLISLLSPRGPRARLSILIFHRAPRVADPLFPAELDAAGFDRVLGWIGRWFKVLPLDAAVQALDRGELPARALAITFDDGYADNHDVAMPLLRKHGMSATFFIATDFLDGGRMWNDTVVEAVRATRLDAVDLAPLGVCGLGRLELRTVPDRRAALGTLLPRFKYLAHPQRQAVVEHFARLLQVDRLPDDLMMSSAQVVALRRYGMQIGAHTGSHPILALSTPEQARDEIVRSRDKLQALLQEPVGMFAYPNGKPGRDFHRGTVDLVRQLGFALAVTTSPGVTRMGTDRWQLPRFTPWDRTPVRFGARLARNLQREPALLG
jgi:peptidoglycan/xylan/chitin deacetylase (PgdA/CDA1 family)